VEPFELGCGAMEGVPFADTGLGGGRIARLCCGDADEGSGLPVPPDEGLTDADLALSSVELPLVVILDDEDLTGGAALRFRVEAAGGFDSEDKDSFRLVFRGLSLADIS